MRKAWQCVDMLSNEIACCLWGDHNLLLPSLLFHLTKSLGKVWHTLLWEYRLKEDASTNEHFVKYAFHICVLSKFADKDRTIAWTLPPKFFAMICISMSIFLFHSSHYIWRYLYNIAWYPSYSDLYSNLKYYTIAMLCYYKNTIDIKKTAFYHQTFAIYTT